MAWGPCWHQSLLLPLADSTGFEKGSAEIVKVLGKKVQLASAPKRSLSQTAPTPASFTHPPQTQQIAPNALVTTETAEVQKEVLQKLEAVFARLQALEASSALHLQLTTTQVSNTQLSSQMGAFTTRLESMERTTLQNSFPSQSNPQLLYIAVAIFLPLLLK